LAFTIINIIVIIVIIVIITIMIMMIIMFMMTRCCFFITIIGTGIGIIINSILYTYILYI